MGIGDGMVATERQGNDIVGQDFLAEEFGDDGNGFGQVKGVDGHIADIGHGERIEGRGAGGHIIGAQQHGFGADLTGTEARAAAVGSADIERDTDKAGIEAGGGFQQRQAHHGGDAAEARHLVATQGLVMDFVHRKYPRS